MQDILEGLNPEQKRAVLATNGPLLIQAGAGSGKTKTLTHRIAYMIQSGQATQDSILAVTFTNKAAREMRERVWALMGYGSETASQKDVPRMFMPWMGTFHSICVRLLRLDGEYVGVPKNFVIFDEADRQSIVKSISKRLGIDEKTYPARVISSQISSAKNDLIDPESFASHARTPSGQVAAEVFPLYEKALHDAKALDFDDLIGKTVLLLEKHTNVRERWQRQFTHIMIDEYQDTNTAQYRLVKLLTGQQQNIAVVGDDWQSIYSWRGADFKNILNFERDYKDCTVIALEQNYRSTAHILNAAHGIITKNQHRSDKKLWTASEEGLKVQVRQLASERAEAEAIVRQVRRANDQGQRELKDFAVLYRTNAQSRTVEEAFLQYGVPYRIVGGVRFYDRKEIKDLLAYLRLLYQPEDVASFQRIVNVPTRGIGVASLGKFNQYAVEVGSLERALVEIEGSSITGKAKKGFIELRDILVSLRRSVDDIAPDLVLDSLVKRLKYLAFLDDKTPQGESRQENVRELIGVAANYQEVGLSGFLEEMALLSDVDTASFGDNVVTLMTLHAAKGLEFPVVCMVGLEESVLPHSRALYDQSEMEEERRLCYVGMTRAREELYMFYTLRRALYGGVQHNIPSRFLSEIDAAYVEHTTIAPTFGRMEFEDVPNEFIDIPAQPKLSDNEPRYVEDFVEGDTVEHQLFGRGTIVEMDGDVAAIYFSGKGVKKLNTAFAPLKKL
ncbi:MAG: ATP-dependent helicase UvrD/PcrA [Patescibacteria group bacterium]|nr:UvrD-helicase domain-containing protein [Candidatus Saccharibacteria bacterium]MDQ5963153.1 ATP-dependent helicase UvrD/PcrA [Patescibacteria group bacterium]